MGAPGKNQIDCGVNFCRERLAPSNTFDGKSFRTVRLANGRLLVVGCPVGEWQPRKKRCRVGMKAQALLRPIASSACKVVCAVKGKKRKGS